MKQKFFKVGTLFIASLFIYSYASACTAVSDERLRAYCLLNEINEKNISKQFASYVDTELKRVGYSRGLGLNDTTFIHKPSLRFNGILEWDDNINSGNPDKVLAIGPLRFNGDPNLVAKKGVVTGVGATLSVRHSYNEGSYVDLTTGMRHVISPQFMLTSSSQFSSFCDAKHLQNWWHINSCFRITATQTDLADTNVKTASVGASKLFTTGNSNYNHVSFAIMRTDFGGYLQNRFVIKHDFTNIWAPNISYSLIIGEPVPNKLATKYALHLNSKLRVTKKFIDVSAQITSASGGKILGYSYAEKNYKLGVSYPLNNKINAKIGYSLTDSTLDYFDREYPIFGLVYEY